MIKKIYTIAALSVCIINAYLTGQYGGFEEGYNYSEQICKIMSFSGWTSYLTLSSQHVFLTVLMAVFLVCKTDNKKYFLEVICLFLLGLISVKYGQIILMLFFGQQWYGNETNIDYSDLFYEPLRKTLILDYFCIFIVVILLVCQIMIVFKHYFSVDQGKAKL